ncbi:Glu-tRNA(Gln) amidotransferase subunit GatE [Candidatus Woesearchaeota archaeon]|nr:Glu-tRNA(Gln) amidotransferase subunit GatE [Candidatus Woesearchaeota archaeon]
MRLLGLVSGIEIHQQLEGEKLFCRCPASIRDDRPDFEVKRYLRAAAGESGTIDAAALAEMKKRKRHRYQGYRDTTCLVELDEEPPGPVNPDALRASLQAAILLGMSVVDQVRFMRKTVVDGSNTSGFQRTALIATSGSFTTASGLRVGVESLCLEEDACKKVESRPEEEVWNLSRLGIPLLEVATAPDMRTPEQVAEAAEHVGMVLRSLPVVKRGLGTIRQDINVSIKEGARVEIKGAQDLKMLATLARYEALRQHNLSVIYKSLRVRGAKVGEVTDVTKVFEGTASKVIEESLGKGGVVLALPLYNFGGLTGLETQPGRRYGSELSDHAKAMGVRGLFHADELPRYGITQGQKDAVFSSLKLDSAEDNFLLVADERGVAERALLAAGNRAADFSLHGEVRQALPDGTTAYLRPMPGAARMYPETDVRPVFVDASSVEVPRLLSERVAELASNHGIAKDVAKRLLRDGLDLDELAKKHPNVKSSFIIDFYYATPGLVKKRYGVSVSMEDFAGELLSKIDAGEISKDAVPEIVSRLAKGERVDYREYRPVSEQEIDAAVKNVLAKDPNAPVGALMGMVMKELGGKADGKAVMARLKASRK